MNDSPIKNNIKMIDYIKLKMAHELADTLTKDTGKRCDIYVSVYHSDVPMYGFRHYATSDDLFETLSIDDLITKLKELTQPKPKYEIGQEVWYKYNDEPKLWFIYQIEWDSNYNEYRYYNDIRSWLTESELYPSRQALIDAQIEYWKGLKQDEIVPVEENQESNICPKCGNRRVADGMCWQAGCNYFEDEKKSCDQCGQLIFGNYKCPCTYKPKFEGEIKGFNDATLTNEGTKCEHESDLQLNFYEGFGIGYKCIKCGEFYK